jgi:hypothetical protein
MQLTAVHAWPIEDCPARIAATSYVAFRDLCEFSPISALSSFRCN